MPDQVWPGRVATHESVESALNMVGNRLDHTHGKRIRIHYGDTETGRDWLDEYGVTGYLSKSMGPKKIPILVHNTRSIGGCGILLDSIVRIRHARGGWPDLYRHPTYHTGFDRIQFNGQVVHRAALDAVLECVQEYDDP